MKRQSSIRFLVPRDPDQVFFWRITLFCKFKLLKCMSLYTFNLFLTHLLRHDTTVGAWYIPFTRIECSKQQTRTLELAFPIHSPNLCNVLGTHGRGTPPTCTLSLWWLCGHNVRHAALPPHLCHGHKWGSTKQILRTGLLLV